MALPYHYEHMDLGFRMACYKLFASTVRHIGLQIMPIIQKAAGIYDKVSLSKQEWQQEKYLIHKMTLNKMIYEESVTVLANARLVQVIGIPATPMLLFVSDGKIEKGWIDNYKRYIKEKPCA